MRGVEARGGVLAVVRRVVGVLLLQRVPVRVGVGGAGGVGVGGVAVEPAGAAGGVRRRRRRGRRAAAAVREGGCQRGGGDDAAGQHQAVRGGRAGGRRVAVVAERGGRRGRAVVGAAMSRDLREAGEGQAGDLQHRAPGAGARHRPLGGAQEGAVRQGGAFGYWLGSGKSTQTGTGSGPPNAGGGKTRGAATTCLAVGGGRARPGACTGAQV